MTKVPTRFTIDFEIPAYWTPDQALAVFELITDLREKIWNHYQAQIFNLLPEHYGNNNNNLIELNPDDIPF